MRKQWRRNRVAFKLPDKIDYVVNGTVVGSSTKAQVPKTDGIYGIRVNHLLEKTGRTLGCPEAAPSPPGKPR